MKRLEEDVPPIYVWNEQVGERELKRLQEELNRVATGSRREVMERLEQRFRGIYERGIVLLTSREQEPKSLLVVRNGIAQEEALSEVYTLKGAYSALTACVDSLSLPKATKETLLGLNLNEYLQSNLEYDAKRTATAIEARLKNISPTRGMVRTGEQIIARGELITPEKYQLLESYRLEHEQNVGATSDKVKITIAQTLCHADCFCYICNRGFFITIFPKQFEGSI